MGLATRIEKNWYGRALGNLWLLPLWFLFVLISALRRMKYRIFPAAPTGTPVLVVGNIAIGGTGKTPLITLLADLAAKQGIRVGVVSRGYGGRAEQYPLVVDTDTPVAQSGDEPALLAGLGLPVVVDPQRARAVKALKDKVDLILSDDGLQHYAMARDAEIVVSDATRGFGNGWQLPVGPLREPISRIDTCDLHLVNGVDFTVQPTGYFVDSVELSPESLKGRRVHAVAGIGNPARFFTTLRQLGADVVEHAFSDHHAFVKDDLVFNDDLPVVMTEKDWVKCRSFDLPNAGFLRVSAAATEAAEENISQLLKRLGAIRHG